MSEGENRKEEAEMGGKKGVREYKEKEKPEIDVRKATGRGNPRGNICLLNTRRKKKTRKSS